VVSEASVGSKIDVVGELVDGTIRKLEVDCIVGSLVGFRVGSSVSVVRGGLGCGIGCSLKSFVSIMEGGVGIWIGCSIGSSVGLQPWEQKPSAPKRKLQRERLPTMIKAIIEL
jgi:hypothetical protein